MMNIVNEADLSLAQRDTAMQQRVAESLAVYAHIDLTIPAQRDVANVVRAEFGLPRLSQFPSPIPGKLKAETPLAAGPRESVHRGAEPHMKAAAKITAIGIGDK